tara:strand:- start:2109 stop:2282 length:174 start_codon:yes stop_codon:yes gene_type:complete
MCLGDEVEVADFVIASIMIIRSFWILLVSWARDHQIVFAKAINILEYILRVKGGVLR